MSPITPVSMIAVPPAAPVDASSAAGGTGAFQSMLEGMIGNVEQSQTQAQQAAQNFLSGGDEELHSVALAAQRADLQFNLFLQVRNKAVSAYQEIMRMQV
ncbi:MAG: flagellar hook-basal body complex protein FliE [Bryobacteraceae bacterium]